ncbi:MAG: hypothetical protein VX000_18610 [Myxococcota bacterium]|nr:hypothetical protein [Myxococcota bacterium]
MPLPLLPASLVVAATAVAPSTDPVIEFDVPVQVDRITQADVDRLMRGSLCARRTTLSWTPGVQLIGPRPRIADTPFEEVVHHIDGVRISGF